MAARGAAGVVSTTAAQLARLVESAQSALARSESHTRTFTVGGTTIRLVSAGPTLMRCFETAFTHLPSVDDDAPADLTVLMWDTESSGEPLPDLGGLLERAVDGTAPVLHDDECSFVYHAYERAVTYLDAGRGLAVYAAADAAVLPPWDRPAPLRTLLTWWFARHGLLLAHGAAVGTDDGAVFITGAGGSGKSTTALACLADGLGYLGDDYVLLDPERQMVWSVYGSAKLVPDHLARFPGLMTPEPTRAIDPPDTKRVGWPAVERPDSMLLSAPIRALVCPTVTRGPVCRLVPTPMSRSFMAIAPFTMFQIPGDRKVAFDLSLRIVRGLHAYRLELGDGMDRVPGMIRDLIAGRIAEPDTRGSGVGGTTQ